VRIVQHRLLSSFIGLVHHFRAAHDDKSRVGDEKCRAADRLSSSFARGGTPAASRRRCMKHRGRTSARRGRRIEIRRREPRPAAPDSAGHI
jgi:hypothetical protein